MLQWLRAAERRLIAAAVLLSLVAGGGVSGALHGSECHDAECAALVPHDASSHRIQSGSSDTGSPLHCVLCHLTRTPRPSPEPIHHVTPATHRDVRLPDEVFVAVSSVQSAQPPLRSPPSAPVALG